MKECIRKASPSSFSLSICSHPSAQAQCDFEEIGSWSPPRSTTLAVDEQHLYLNRGGDLLIASRDLTGELLILGELDLPGNIEHILPEGDRLWIASGDEGLFLVDITDPTLPTLISTIDTPGQAVDSAIRDQYAYIADGANGLLILDLWNPQQPVEVGHIPFFEAATDVAISDDFAYLALGEGGIGVVDISNPRRAQFGSVYPSINPVKQVETVGEHLFAMMPEYGLRVYSPESSGILLEQDSLRWSSDRGSYGYATVTSDESYAYFLSDKKLTLIDITDPENILPVAWHPLSSGEPLDIVVADESIFFLTGPADDSTDQSIVEITRDDGELTKAPPFLSSISSQSQPHDLSFLGDYAYTAEERGGMGITDNSDPDHPRYLHSFDTTYDITDVIVQGNHSYHSWHSGYGPSINAIDLSMPTNPVELGPEGQVGGIGGVLYFRPKIAISDDRGILVTQWESYGGLSEPEISVFDLSNPGSPELIAEPFGIYYYTVSIATKNGLLLAITFGDDSSGLLAYDISDPQAITQLEKQFPQIANIRGMFFFGDLLLFTAGSTLYVVDYRDPYNPFLLGEVTSPEVQFGGLITAQGYTAYLGHEHSDRILQIDLSDPSHPGILKEMSFGFPVHNLVSKEGATYLLGKETQSFQINPAFDSTGYEPLKEANSATLPWFNIANFRLTVQGDTAVMYSWRDYWIVDLTAPQDMGVTGPFTLEDHIASMVVNPPFLYSLGSIDETSHARVIDLSNPTSPEEMGEISTSLEHPDQALLENGYLFLLDSENFAVERFSLSIPSSPQPSHAFTLPGAPGSIRDTAIENQLILYTTTEGLYVVDYSLPPSSNGWGFLEEPNLSGGVNVRFPYVYLNRLDFTSTIVDSWWRTFPTLINP